MFQRGPPVSGVIRGQLSRSGVLEDKITTQTAQVRVAIHNGQGVEQGGPVTFRFESSRVEVEQVGVVYCVPFWLGQIQIESRVVVGCYEGKGEGVDF